MQCYNTTIEWIDCEILAVVKNRCAVYTRAIGTNAVFKLQIRSLSPGVFIHLNPSTKLQLCYTQNRFSRHSGSFLLRNRIRRNG